MIVSMTERELATVLAALRHWQRQECYADGGIPEHTIASDEGEHEPLDAQEIDELCERLNRSER